MKNLYLTTRDKLGESKFYELNLSHVAKTGLGKGEELSGFTLSSTLTTRKQVNDLINLLVSLEPTLDK
jgi:hypothetical protein